MDHRGISFPRLGEGDGSDEISGDREMVVSFMTNQLLRHEELDEVRMMAMATTEPFQHVVAV